MTTYTSTAGTAHHTTAAGVEDVVVLDKAYPVVEVINRDAANGIWFTLSTGVANASDVTASAGADGMRFVPAGGVARVTDDDFVSGSPSPSRVHVFSAAASAYSVQGIVLQRIA